LNKSLKHHGSSDLEEAVNDETAEQSKISVEIWKEQEEIESEFWDENNGCWDERQRRREKKK